MSEDLQVKIERLQQRLSELQAGILSGEIKQAEALTELTEELASSVEELSVSEEELRTQNEELVAAQEALIAEQRRYQELVKALEKSEREHKELVKYAPAAIYEVNFRTRRFTSVNDAMCQMSGYSRKELLKMNPFDLLDESSRAVFQERINQCLAGQQPSQDVEYRAIRRNGRKIDVALNVKFTTDAEGKPQSATVIGYDITERKKMEAAVREIAEKYALLFDTTSDGVWIHSLDGVIHDVNDAYCRMSGYSREELQGMPISKLEAVESSVEIADHIQKVLQQGGHDRFESRHRRKDGSIFDVDITALFLPREGGRIAVFVRDVTQRKQAEEALRKSKASLAEAQRIAHLGNWEWDLQSGLVDWSDQMYEIFGEQRNAFTPGFESFLARVHEDDRQNIEHVIREAIKALRPYTFEARILTARGEVRFLLVRAEVMADAENQPCRVIGTVLDITVRRQAEESLRDSERRYRAIFENATDAIIVTDPCDRGRVLSVNSAACRMFGYDADEFVGLDREAILDHSDPNLAEIMKRRETLGWAAGPLTYIRRDGNRFQGDIASSLCKDEQGKELAIAVIRDVTEQLQAEEQIRHQNAILEGINRIFKMALSAGSEEEFGNRCLAIAEEVTGSKFGFMGEITSSGRLDDLAISNPGWEVCRLEDSSGHRTPPTGFKIHGIYGRVLKDGKGFYTNDPATHPDRIGLPEGHPPLTAFVGVPLFRDGRTIGMIALANRPGGYRDQDLEALESLSAAIVIALTKRRAEEALHQSQEKYRLLLENANSIIVRWNPDGTIISFNEFAQQFFGFTESEIIGQNAVGTFVPATDTAGRDLSTMVEEIIRHPEHYQANENENVRKNGERVWVAWSNKALYDSQGNIAEFLSIGIDITARKQAEEVIAASLKQKETLLKEIHHRIKNNLQTVNALLALQSQSLSDETAKRFFRESQNRIRTISLVHEQLYNSITLEKIHFGKYLDSLVNNLIRSSGVKPGGVNIQINAEEVWLDVDTAMPCGLIVNELVTNALRHAFPEGRQGRVLVRFKQNNGYILTVEDDGVGLPQDQDISKLSSLGLQLVRSLTQQLDGKLDITCDHGSCFQVTFPKQAQA